MHQSHHIRSGRRALFPMALRLLGVLLTLSILMTPRGTASAHANLVRSDPPIGAALNQPPKAITLEFSEALDPGFSQVQLVDGSSKVIVPGPGAIDPGNHQVMTLQIGSLPDGVYSAIWKARSAVDGHTTFGTVGFSVGATTSRVSLLPPPGTPDPATALPQPVDSATRWLGYVMAAILMGSIVFGLLVWRPVVQGHDDETESSGAVTRLLRRLALIGLGGLLIATIAFVFVEAGQASGKGFFALFGTPLGTYLGTRSGVLLEIRLALMAVMAAIVIWRLPGIEAGRGGTWWLLAALATGVLITFSLQSHGASSDLAGAVILDTAHLLAMSAWMGGLLPLALLLRASQRGAVSLPPLGALVPSFSRVALASVGVLAVSGFYSVLTQVRTFDALVGTTYGQTVIVKTALVAALIGLGAINLEILTPQLAQSTDDPTDAGHNGNVLILRLKLWAPDKALRRTTTVELGIGLVVLLAAGVLLSIQPAATALDAQHRLGFLDTANTDDVRLTLRVAPAQIGDNEFGVDVTDKRPGAADADPQVLLRVGVQGGALGLNQVEAAPTGGGRYTARGTYITLPGDWQVDVILRRPGFDDVVHRFTMQVGSGSAASALSQEDQTPNPIQPDAESVAAGKTLYTTNCVPCHGAKGKGDGPVGLTLNPRPADLTVHATPGVHTDGQLFKWISEGYPGSVMPAFAQYLSETDRWNLVNFIRTLAPSTK